MQRSQAPAARAWAHVVPEPPVLAGLNRYRRRGADAGVAGEVLGRHRLLHPFEVEPGQAADAPQGLGRGQRLVVVDHQPHAGADDLAHRGDVGHVPGQVPDADLDLDRAKPLLEAPLQRRPVRHGVDDAVTVVGRDRPGPPPEQLDHRPLLGAPLQVPQGHVQTRQGHADEPLPPHQAEARDQVVIPGRGTGRAPAHHLLHVLEKGLQGPQREGGVAEDVGAADRTLLRDDVYQQERRDRDVARRGAQGPGQRRGDGARGQRADGQSGFLHDGLRNVVVRSNKSGFLHDGLGERRCSFNARRLGAAGSAPLPRHPAARRGPSGADDLSPALQHGIDDGAARRGAVRR